MKYIEIDKSLIPYTFEIELSGEVVRMEVYYNDVFDYFTLDLYQDGEPVILGEKLVLNEKAFDIISYLNLIKVDLIPRDLSEINNRITWENLNEQVFLYLGDEDE